MEGLLESFITLLVIMNPFASLPLFISLTKGTPSIEIRKIYKRCIFVAGIILFVFLLFGISIFNFIGISINSFQIAGGILLLIIGITYILGISSKYFGHHDEDLSVPIATPLLTGPGVITATILLVNQFGILVTSIAAFLTLFVTWIVLLNSIRLYKVLGKHWTTIISRVMGLIIAAYAVELMFEGILNTIGSLL
ncbi:antibiotic resistance protein MarC [Candidatus Woesearchaeota archaeon]|nr:antibiotic resistance protein MarC [Candidatus Woesearchaeota archaeon]|tara:strand:+ start:34870 stop:35454 length:585 start_codon:yes stop_codon:yes gene_type:complete